MAVIAKSAKQLRARVLRELRQTGISANGLVVPPNGGSAHPVLSKDDIRQLHARQRKDLLKREARFIGQWQDELLASFADGKGIVPEEISPRVTEVTTEEEAALFRYASLHWSVPVSKGYGRRMRFLLFDDFNDKLIGIFALGDPVYNLTARDEVIGWDVEQRNDRLYNVLDAFVLGAMPPYQQLLGGKLVAMAAVSNVVREKVREKYAGRRTRIRGETKQSRPVLITTTSALGRSSIYNRLKYQDRLLFRSVGYTRGFGHFHFSEDLFHSLMGFLSEDGGVPGYEYGQGPNWRIRTLRVALSKIDLDPNLIQHGIKREVFLAPLAEKWKRFLLGEIDRPNWFRLDLSELAEHFKSRWALPRAERDSRYLDWRRQGLTLEVE